MITNLLFTKLFYIATIISSLFAISTSSAVVAVILLIASFVCAALLLINIGLVFLGLSYIIIYVGAIAVLFLFAIMLLDISIKEINSLDKEYRQNLLLGISLSFFFTIFYNSLIIETPTGLYVPSFNSINIDSLYNNLINSLYNLFNMIINLKDSNIFIDNKDFIFNIIHYNSFPNGDYFSMHQISHAETYLKNFEQISSLGFGLYNNYPLVYLLTGFILLFAMYAAVILTKRG
jgi:NADH-ubiquinone oxidoreductase chain 6